MMSIEAIREETRTMAKEARAKNLKPFEVWPGDVDTMPPFPFPFIGSYKPKGWRKVAEYFVDMSGMGSDNEPALSVKQFKAMLKVGYAYAVIEAGQFQCYVAEFKLIKPRKKSAGDNTPDPIMPQFMKPW